MLKVIYCRYYIYFRKFSRFFGIDLLLKIALFLSL
jgi:hypothetical protein